MLKTTSRAEYVYARLEARRAGADDALFLTVDGHCSESTSANLFVIRTATDGVDELVTPSLECAILPGTTRSWLLDWAPQAGLRPVESTFGPGTVGTAREAFLSSSVAGILPVTRFENRPIGDGRPGALTLQARADRESMIRSGGAP
jgi:branched-subunit amino acid aminotransferase/4-amino-4-deoxychorismate lyase